MNLRWKNRLAFLLLFIGGIFLIYGMARGEMDVVFTKAVNICLECVGIG